MLLQFATLRLPSAKVMAYTYLTPSWVILWEIALGREAPQGMVLVGVGLSVVALLLLLKPEDQSSGIAGSASSTRRNRSNASRFTGSN